MKQEEIVKEFKKLEREHIIWRYWCVAIALIIIGLGFYLIGNHEIGYSDNFSIGNAITPFGAVILGYIVSNWSGNSAHKLLKKIVSDIGGEKAD